MPGGDDGGGFAIGCAGLIVVVAAILGIIMLMGVSDAEETIQSWGESIADWRHSQAHADEVAQRETTTRTIDTNLHREQQFAQFVIALKSFESDGGNVSFLFGCFVGVVVGVVGTILYALAKR